MAEYCHTSSNNTLPLYSGQGLEDQVNIHCYRTFGTVSLFYESAGVIFFKQSHVNIIKRWGCALDEYNRPLP